jgi:hypothetical protein
MTQKQLFIKAAELAASYRDWKYFYPDFCTTPMCPKDKAYGKYQRYRRLAKNDLVWETFTAVFDTQEITTKDAASILMYEAYSGLV